MRGMARAAITAIIGFVIWVATTADAAAEESWATRRARDLVNEGKAHRAAGHVDVALERFRSAIETDVTYGDAYLELARLREETGEPDEAERVLAVALDHIPGFTEGLRERARIEERSHRYGAAAESLLAATNIAGEDEAILTRLVEVAAKANQLPVALASARRLVAMARAAGNDALVKDRSVTVTALERLLGDVDPVVAGKRSKEAARRALAHRAKPATKTSKSAAIGTASPSKGP
jgi:tetratricopeptide (TPR) repeat protein